MCNFDLRQYELAYVVKLHIDIVYIFLSLVSHKLLDILSEKFGYSLSEL